MGVLLNRHGAVVETTKTTVKELNPLLVAFPDFVSKVVIKTSSNACGYSICVSNFFHLT